MTSTHGPEIAVVTDPQRRIAALRAGLFGGRGPGASATELEAHQHQRVVIGGMPVTAAREQLAVATTRARATPLDDAQAHAARYPAHPDGPVAGPDDRPGRTAVVLPLAVGVGALLGYAAAHLHRHGPR